MKDDDRTEFSDAQYIYSSVEPPAPFLAPDQLDIFSRLITSRAESAAEFLDFIFDEIDPPGLSAVRAAFDAAESRWWKVDKLFTRFNAFHFGEFDEGAAHLVHMKLFARGSGGASFLGERYPSAHGALSASYEALAICNERQKQVRPASHVSDLIARLMPRPDMDTLFARARDELQTAIEVVSRGRRLGSPCPLSLVLAETGRKGDAFDLRPEDVAILRAMAKKGHALYVIDIAAKSGFSAKTTGKRLAKLAGETNYVKKAGDRGGYVITAAGLAYLGTLDAL